jgi:uncharacterized membrane protein YphA (DoxX/SURF4 family)
MWAAAILTCRIVVIAVFFSAGAVKIAHPHEFAASIFAYRLLPDSLINITAILLPWMECLCALALMVPAFRAAAASILVVLLCIFTIAMATAVARGIDTTCGCYSGADRVVDWLTVLRNLCLLGAAAIAGLPAIRSGRESSAPLEPGPLMKDFAVTS